MKKKPAFFPAKAAWILDMDSIPWDECLVFFSRSFALFSSINANISSHVAIASSSSCIFFFLSFYFSIHYYSIYKLVDCGNEIQTCFAFKSNAQKAFRISFSKIGVCVCVTVASFRFHIEFIETATAAAATKYTQNQMPHTGLAVL